MKKLFYLIAIFAFVFSGPMMASADRVHIPIVFNYSNANNYSTIFVQNLASEAMNVTVTFRGSDILENTTGASAVSAVHTGKSVGTTIQPYSVWNVNTSSASIWGVTTGFLAAKVEIQSSATDHPYVEGASYNGGVGVDGVGKGPIAVNAAFVSADLGAPSGFVLPVFYRVRSWASTNPAGTAGLYTVDNWGQ